MTSLRYRLVLLFILFAGFLHGQEDDRAGYVILSHRVRLHLFPQSNVIACSDTLSVRLTDVHLRQLRIGLVRLYTIADITLQGKEQEFTRERDDFVIDHIPSDSLLELVVVYSGNFPFRSEFSSFSSERAVLREEELLPSGPKAYEYMRMNITVPKSWDAIASGNRISYSATADSATFVYECPSPVPNIGWICAGKFLNRGSDDQQPSVAVHLFAEDSSSADSIIELAHEALRFYGNKFSSYRYAQLSIVEVEDWVAGRNVLAIAVPSFIMVKKMAFTTKDNFNMVGSVLPHEIAHQWWPMTVFIHDEDAAFLSEGMCEYSALLFNQSRGKMGKRDSLATHPLLRSLLTRVENGRDLPLEQKADLRSLPTHYLKASYVHNMLRRTIGDSAFAALYYEYAHRFAMKQVVLDDFRHLAEELSGKKLDLFFDQWIKKKGVPRMKLYNVKSSLLQDKWHTHGHVRMVGYDKYTTCVEVGVRIDSTIARKEICLGIDSLGVYHNDVAFEILTERKPSVALLDPDGDVLKIQKLPVKLGDLRDPSDGIMIVGTGAHRGYLLSRARIDSTAMTEGGWSITIKDDTSISLADLQQEKLFIYGKPAENRVAASLEKRFPLTFHGDSVRINGQTIFENSLTLVQATESPYIAQGLICWIAPLSERAQPELLPYDVSWALIRGKDEISSGTWEVKDEDLQVEIR